MKLLKLTYSLPFISAVALFFALGVSVVSAQVNGKPGSGNRSQSDMNSKPYLEVNGKKIQPIADFKSDFVLSVPQGKHTWTLLKENTSSKDINQFGFYSDIGVGRNRVPIFLGPDNSQESKLMIETKPTELGLWLLNDRDNDSYFSSGEALLFSERSLTVGVEDPERQYFMVFDVSAYKGTGAEYEFETKGSEFETRGDFDFLIFADDSRSGNRFDYNDMIIGLLLRDTTDSNHTPAVTCPGDTKMTVCDLSSVCLSGFGYFDPDYDIETVELTGGEFDGDLVCFTPHEGRNTLTLKVTDRTGRSDSCSVDIDVTLNHPPVIEDQFFSGAVSSGTRPVFFKAGDLDNDVLEYRILEGVGEIIPVPDGGLLNYSPDTSGVYSFIVEASDSCSADTALIQDSIKLIQLANIEYVKNSLRPNQVSAGGIAQFSFEIELKDSVALYPSASIQIQGTRYGFAASSTVEIPGGTLTPGINHLTSDFIFIPKRLIGDSLRLRLHLTYSLPGVRPVLRFATDFDNQRIPVVQMPLVRIVDVVNKSPNSPKVNSGQSFTVECRVANLTALATPPFDLRMLTDGNSIFDSLVAVPSIAPFDTVTAVFNVVAETETNPLELFHVDVASQIVGESPSVNNFAPAVIQTPASLRLLWTLFGTRSGTVEPGRQFSLMVRLENDGESEVTPGQFSLSSNGAFLGTDDPIIGDIPVDTTLTFHFTAPSADTSFLLSFSMTDLPLDINSTLPVQLVPDSFEISLRVMTEAGDIVASAKKIGPNVVATGKAQELFELTLTNNENGHASPVSVDEISLRLTPNANGPADLLRFIDLSKTGFVRDGALVTTAEVEGEVLRLTFANMVIPAGATESIRFQLGMRERVNEAFHLTLTTDDIVALFTSDPLAGDSARVVSSDGGKDLFNQQYATIGNDLQSSLEIENNPFNPLEGAANFAYFLTQPGDIEFRIFSLIGEEVYALDVAEGMAGTEPNIRQLISWSGRNSSGSIVNNGVYVAMILQKSSGQKATIKVAVLK